MRSEEKNYNDVDNDTVQWSNREKKNGNNNG